MNTFQHVASTPRSSPYKREPRLLAAPDVKVAYHDEDTPGLVPIHELDNPLIVNFAVWDAAKTGYTYTLVFDDTVTGPEQTILETDRPGDELTLEIPTTLLSEGTHTVAYRAYSPFSNVAEISSFFSITIDRTAPGKPELGVIQFPVEVQNGLTLAELVQLGNVLNVEIASYTQMSKHDTIHTFWGEKPGPVVNVSENEMGLDKIIFDFTREFLESVESGTQVVKYHVVDRAGNVSEDSLAVEITLLLQEISEDYPAPILDPAIGDLVDYSEAKSGVKVEIPSYPDVAAGDEVTFYWGDDLPMQPIKIPPGNEGDDIVLTLEIHYETIALLPTDTITLTYSVSRSNQVVGTSLPTMVEVFLTLPIPEPTSPPIIQGTSVNNPNKDDNFIDEDDYELNGRAILTWNSAYKESDNINLYWGDQYRAQWYQISEDDVTAAKDLVIPIANSIIKSQGTGIEIPARYTIVRDSNPNETKSPTQFVTVRSKESLPGGPDGLEGPPFNLNPLGYLSPWLNENGADVKIEPYINISEKQKLFFTFKGFDQDNNPIESATYTNTRVMDDLDVVSGYTFTVPYAMLRTLCYGFAEASFRVEPAPGSNQSAVTSKTTRVPVEMRAPSENSCPI